ncbi:uncharacterized protein LOC115356163 [Myripristis murdjan]|uniref:uncharacterized protein LOC115356163 n=1 Tax=Myripristis murdjan TaxID=586833 RepID=UPI0011763E18|nr:uncharacterized protein LOC115356163 [Myripristis murdjan]
MRNVRNVRNVLNRLGWFLSNSELMFLVCQETAHSDTPGFLTGSSETRNKPVEQVRTPLDSLEGCGTSWNHLLTEFLWLQVHTLCRFLRALQVTEPCSAFQPPAAPLRSAARRQEAAHRQEGGRQEAAEEPEEESSADQGPNGTKVAFGPRRGGPADGAEPPGPTAGLIVTSDLQTAGDQRAAEDQPLHRDAEEEEETVMKAAEHLGPQQGVLLALDVSLFYLQADGLLSSISRKRRGSADQTDDIIAQIRRLQQSVSRLSGLHPTLELRVKQKEEEVLHCWSRVAAAGPVSCDDVGAELRSALQSTTSTDKTLCWLNDSEPGLQPISCQEAESARPAHEHSLRSPLTLRINALLSRCAELSMDVLDAESELLLRCEPDRSDLDGLQELQRRLEGEQLLVRQEVERLLTSDLRAERQEAALQAQEELGCSLADNREALLQLERLRGFLRSYLDMISWAEETRARVLSEAVMQRLSRPEWDRLDRAIQQKFEDFDDLVESGRRLVTDRRHLADSIKERTEELQSMLGWILVHWRAQKEQLSHTEPDSPGDELPHPTQLQPPSAPDESAAHQQEAAEEPEEESSAVQGPNGNKVAFGPRRGGSADGAEPPGPTAAGLVVTADPQTARDQRAAEDQPLHRVRTFLQVPDGNSSDSSPKTNSAPLPPSGSPAASRLSLEPAGGGGGGKRGGGGGE